MISQRACASLAVGPGGLFVVNGAVVAAAVEEPDEAVARGSKCSVVGVTGGASGVGGAGAGEESSAHDEVRVVGSDGIPLG